MDLDDVLIQLKKDGDFEAGTGVPEERIKEAEISLATTFPEGYREFLIKYGFIEWSEAEIFGISENEYFDTVSRTLKRKAMDVPAEYVFPAPGNIIANYAGGGFYFLYSQNSPESGAVIECLDVTWWKPERKWNSFVEYLASFLA